MNRNGAEAAAFALFVIKTGEIPAVFGAEMCRSVDLTKEKLEKNKKK